MERNDKDPLLKVGGLWESKDRQGNMVLGGGLGGVRIVILKNGYKEKENQPDYILYFTKNQRQEEYEAKKGPEGQASEEPSNPHSLDDVPF